MKQRRGRALLQVRGVGQLPRRVGTKHHRAHVGRQCAPWIYPRRAGGSWTRGSLVGAEDQGRVFDEAGTNHQKALLPSLGVGKQLHALDRLVRKRTIALMAIKSTRSRACLPGAVPTLVL